ALIRHARDIDQVSALVKELKNAGGGDYDTAAHLGYVTRWMVNGPHDNGAGAGFARAYPPEAKVDLSAGWKPFATADRMGMVDLYQALGLKRGVDKETNKKPGYVAYAFAAVESPEERPVEIRAGSTNAVKIFLNGEPVFFREEYHHGHHADQHSAKVTLKKGRNEVMIKVCQDEATEAWTVTWSFQLRLCDAIGGAVPLKVLTALDATPVELPVEKKEKK